MTTELVPSTEENYTVARYPGVAFHFLRLETEHPLVCYGHIAADCGQYDGPIGEVIYCPDGCEPDEDDEVPTGMWIMSMVGDDHPRVIDPDDVTLYDHPVCSCGQIGCGWHGEEG